MEDNKNQQANNHDAGPNPTLNEPGSKVADYGNPTGGSGNDDIAQSPEQHGAENDRSANRGENNDTIGTP